MEKRVVRLNEVDITEVTLPELVRFMEALRQEFPIAVRIIAKKLFEQEYGISKPASEPLETFDVSQGIDESQVLEGFRLLKDEFHTEMAGVMILSLHKGFGFGRTRVLRLWEGAQAMLGSTDTVPAEELAKWCEARGIDYEKEFGGMVHRHAEYTRNHDDSLNSMRYLRPFGNDAKVVDNSIEEAAVTNEQAVD